jgi:hypothetical protein
LLAAAWLLVLGAALLDVTPQDKIGTWACLLCWRLWPKFFCNLCEK